MAVVYFTSNASTGAGSLVETVANASPGDVIRPDATVFERGSTIEIALASSLNVAQNLTLDASPCRVRLIGGGAFGCAAVATGVNADFTAFDFIGGVASQNGGGLLVEPGANVVLSRCRVCGCDAAQNGGGIYVGDAAILTANDSAIFGNRAQFGGGVYVGDDAATTFNGATVCGNVDANAGLDIDGETTTSALAAVNSILGNAFDGSETLGSVVGVALSSVSFAAPPPDGLTFAGWSSNAWQNWDLRLFDDASSNPSPYRDSGNVGEMSQYDLQGNFRGRETGGVATCSPGAYETLQADLFWIGRDATGAEIISPSFLTSNGWAASRFATVSGDVAPQVGQKLFVDGVVVFSDVLTTANANGQRFALTLGGGANVRFPSATVYLFDLQVGAGVTFTFSSVRPSEARFGDWSRLAGTFSALPKYNVGSQVYIQAAFMYSYVQPSAFYGTLTVYAQDSQGLRLGGAYECDVFRIRTSGATGNPTVVTALGTTVSARVIEWGGESTTFVEKLTSEPLTFVLRGAASVTVPGGAPESWADHFIVDVSEATSAALTLNGQTVYGDAPTCAAALTGTAKIDGRGLGVASMTLNADAKLMFVDNASVVLTSISVVNAIAMGAGAFFAPVAAPNGLTLENGALWCDASANVTSLNVRPTSATTATFSVVKTNVDANIVAQYSDDDGATWRTVETTADVDEYELTVAQGADVTVRVATATGWLTDTVSTAPFLPVWTVSNGYEMVVGVSNVFEIATGGSNDGLNTYDFNNYGYL